MKKLVLLIVSCILLLSCSVAKTIKTGTTVYKLQDSISPAGMNTLVLHRNYGDYSAGSYDSYNRFYKEHIIGDWYMRNDTLVLMPHYEISAHSAPRALADDSINNFEGQPIVLIKKGNQLCNTNMFKVLRPNVNKNGANDTILVSVYMEYRLVKKIYAL